MNKLGEEHLGYKLIESKVAVIVSTAQVRKHNKKRINKKWAKRYGYKTIEKPMKELFLIEDKIIGLIIFAI